VGTLFDPAEYDLRTNAWHALSLKIRFQCLSPFFLV
jgi:hypothetical protein